MRDPYEMYEDFYFIDTKIIESAINFWFKDDDYKGGCKIWKYFKEA